MDIAPHVRLAAIGEDLVVFDLRHDRYLALVGAVDASSGPTAMPTTDPCTRLHHKAAQALRDAGFLTDGEGGTGVRHRPADRALEAAEARVNMRDLGRLLVAMMRIGWRIRRGRHVARFSIEPLPPCSSIDRERLHLAIAKLRRLRLYVPTPARCLPAALIAAFFLRHSGVDVDLVFGVRGHPFDAHCWIERDGIVLDDDLDRVAAYTPIAIGVPRA